MLCFPGKESTLFVVLFVNRYEYDYDNEDFQKCISTIEGCVKETLPLIPHTKLLIIDASSTMMKKEEIAPETLQVYLRRQNVLGTFLEHLNKRYKSLDLIAVMMELKRTVQLTPDFILLMTLTLTMVTGNFHVKSGGALKFTKTCLVFQDFKIWNKCWRKVILKGQLKLNFMSGHHQSRGTQRRFPPNALKTLF